MDGPHAPTPRAANIGPRGRQVRRAWGVAAIVSGVAVAIVLTVASAPPLWGIAVFVPWWLGVLGFEEARTRTCVALAARGARNMDGREELVTHSAERFLLARQARAVRWRATVLAAIGAGIVVGVLA
ncbi:MAG TPA: hypothetical protein VGA37_07770 [Gemmatimonadales bacterium]